jgi:hypothetical protein
MIFLKKKKGGKNMNIGRLKNADDAVLGIATIRGLLLFIVAGVIILALITLVFGIFTLIGMCLLIGAAFVLYMKKGSVTIAPNSVFMWLLISGLILLFFGQFVMDIGSIDLGAVPGMETIHNFIRVNGS